MPGPSAGYLGQIQVAANSAGSPGSFAALSEGSKATPSKKKAQVDSSLLGAGPGHRRTPTLGDLDLKLEHFWDSGDVALQAILSALTGLDRVFARVFRDTTHYMQAPLFPAEVAVESEPGSLSKVSSSLMLDGTLASPSESTGTLLAPAAMPAPVAAYKSIAGIGTPGASTSTTNEATTQIGSSKSYQVTDTTKRLMDPASAVTVKDNNVTVTVASGNLIAVDMLFGIVTFAGGYSVNGPVTVDFHYIPVAAMKWVKKLTSTMKLDLKDVTDINSSGWVKRAITAIDFTTAFDVEDLSSNDPQGGSGNIGSTPWSTLVTGGTPVLIEHDPDGTQTQVIRAWVLLESLGEPVAFGDIITQSFSGSLASRTNGIYAAAYGIGAP